MLGFRLPRWFGGVVAGAGGAALVLLACGEDDAIVRPRLEGGAGDAAIEGGEGGTGALACGPAVPVAYVSADFTANATVEIGLLNALTQLDNAMAATEGTSTTVASASDLKAIYDSPTPSLLSVSTSTTQGTVNGYLEAFGAAGGKTWQPTDAEQDGGAANGGKYASLFYESAVGVDIRAATTKTLYGGALYNQVLGIVAAPMTQPSVDRILAAFGASTALANRTDVDAGAAGDRFVAELASKRDDKSNPSPGIYRKMKADLLTLKAAVTAPEACKQAIADVTASFLLEWEHAIYASAIYSLNAAATSAADPTKGAVTLHSFGEAIGLIQSFRGLAADKRKITDAQITQILTKIGAENPYKLVTSPGTTVLQLEDAINDIQLFEGFDAQSVESFKKSF